MTDQQQPRPGDRVRVTYEATVSEVSALGVVVLLPGDELFQQRYTTVPASAVVEVLEPPTLAHRMAALADELEAEPGYGGYGDGLGRAVRRIREELATAKKTSKRRLCGFTHAGPWNLDAFCFLPAGHDGFRDRPNRTEAAQ